MIRLSRNLFIFRSNPSKTAKEWFLTFFSLLVLTIVK